MFVVDLEATGKNLKQIRIEHDKTKNDIAKYLGIGTYAIYKWEKGKNLPTVDHLFYLSKLYLIPMEELIVAKIV